VEVPVLQIRKQLLNPHPAAVGTHRRIARFLIGVDQPRIVLLLGMAEGKPHRFVFAVFCNDDLLQVAALFFGDEVPKLPPRASPGGANVRIPVESEAKTPSLILDKFHQISSLPDNFGRVGRRERKRDQERPSLIEHVVH
jgi:hypothetical protein